VAGGERLSLTLVATFALSETFSRVAGSGGMNSFWKGVLVVLAVLLAVKLLPGFLLVPFFVGVPLLILAECVFGGLATLFTVGFVVIGALALVALVLLAALSPIWIPLLLIVGLVALIARAARA